MPVTSMESANLVRTVKLPVAGVSTTQLLVNSAQAADHSVSVEALFQAATQLDCMVAFARSSGYAKLETTLCAALDAGLSARFVVGLDFYHTEPPVLEALFALVDWYPDQFEFFISGQNRMRTFHPKAYAFQYADASCKVVIGSANLTAGGLSLNHEFSLFTESSDCTLADQVASEIADLLQSGEIEVATQERLDEYARCHKIYALHNRAAKLNAEVDCKSSKITPSSKGAVYLPTLLSILTLMKADPTASGFISQQGARVRRHANARGYLDGLRTQPVCTSAQFMTYYEPLVSGSGWHSGGLERGKNIVAQQGLVFQAGMRDLYARLQTNPKLSAEDAYSQLHGYLSRIPRAGTNVLTEALHTFDPLRFAVMNQNSVNGMTLAGYRTFPAKPNKSNVDATLYADFCAKAKRVCAALGLANLGELDALFNYAYWAD
ncbi:phospholipase D-like domain-containing protein [Glaciimonas sp. PCH181]|uniref:phospholipase D-like domain-containing protein n=1 Tax=Glaciimonas sp. PCH181 TaxID=2133943 RepID=UPI000D3D6987|nr:phospholipase D-like domain-containing protein [Glaciimonas sp. PCH181]PUA19159.1 NgoFVII family restriction endonuclease [Glaciimonas sp. PCH181]